MDEPMNFHAGAPKIAPRILCIGMPVRDLTFRVQGLPARGSKENASHFDEICGGNALNAAIGIVRLGGRASICGPMGDARETSSRFIFDKLAHEGIDTRHIVHMPGLVTPISNIMIDPSGERTIVTFRDPELWKVQPARHRQAAAGLRRHPDRKPLRRILHRAVRRGPPARHSRHRRCRSRDVAARGSAHRVVASGVLQRAVADHRRRRQRRRCAAEDRKADPVHSWRERAAPQGTIWLDEQQTLQQTAGVPGAYRGHAGRGRRVPWRVRSGHHRKPGSASRPCGSPPPPRR